MSGRDMADLMADDEGERLGVAGLTADFEQVAVHHDVAAKAVPAGEGVDQPVAQHHVGVGNLAEPEPAGRLDDEPVAFGELGR